MPKVDFNTLPDEARAWVFAADRALGRAEAQRLLESVDAFLHDWQAHGAPLTCGREWRYDRFLIVAVDERTAPPSGCSIDAFVRSLKALESELGVTLLDNTHIWYHDRGDELRRVDRPTFRAMADAGDVGRTPSSSTTR